METNLACALSEQEQEQEILIITNDFQAESLLVGMAQEKVELQRYINVCETMKQKYQYEAQKAQEAYDKKFNWKKTILQSYFESVPKKESKTQITYKLPSATLKIKKSNPEFKRDDVILAEYLKENLPEYTETVIRPKWAELKKNTTVMNNAVIYNETGEVVPGVQVIDRPDEFIIEF